MANTIMPTVFASGTRRFYTLKGYSTLGVALDDTAQGMIGEGWNQIVINNLVQSGASDAQLQSLWDNYNPDADGYQAASALQGQLVAQNAPGAGPILSAAGDVASSIIQTAYGALDLTAQTSWDFISGQLIQTQQQLNALARSAPKDPDVIQMVSDFNGMVGQYAGYYQQVFGSSPSNIPMASFPSMSGLGIAPIVIGGAIAAAIVALLAALYLLNQRIVAKAALIQAQSASQTTSNVGTLTNTYQQQVAAAQAAYAAGNKALGDMYATQAQASLGAIQKVGAAPPPSSVNFSTWFQQNWGWMAMALGAMVILPPIVKKL